MPPAYGVTACARPLTSGPSPRPLQARAPSASPARRATFAPTPTFDGIRRELGPSDGAGDDGAGAVAAVDDAAADGEGS